MFMKLSITIAWPQSIIWNYRNWRDRSIWRFHNLEFNLNFNGHSFLLIELGYMNDISFGFCLIRGLKFLYILIRDIILYHIEVYILETFSCHNFHSCCYLVRFWLALLKSASQTFKHAWIPCIDLFLKCMQYNTTTF